MTLSKVGIKSNHAVKFRERALVIASPQEHVAQGHMAYRLLIVQFECAAIDEARARLAAAITAAEQAQARADAKEMRETLRVLTAAAADIDSSLEDFVASTHELRDAVNKLHSLGCQFPTHAQIESHGTRVVQTAIGQSIFKRAVETLPPSERRTFGPLVAEWVSTISRNYIEPLLGETSNEKAA
jgi:hypothetical protein